MPTSCVRPALRWSSSIFAASAAIVSGLHRLARLIADRQPDIVQGWMYHGDLAALIALGLSGRRRHDALVWSIRCSDMDLTRYGLGLRLWSKACAALSRSARSVTANSAAGLEAHLGLGYRPRRPRSWPTASTSTSSSPTRRRARRCAASSAFRRCDRARPCRARRPDEGSRGFSRGDGGTFRSCGPC